MLSSVLKPKNPTLIFYAFLNYILPWLLCNFLEFRPIAYKFPALTIDQIVYGAFLILILLMFGWLPWERREEAPKYSTQEWDERSGLQIPVNTTIAVLFAVIIFALVAKFVFSLDSWRYSDTGISQRSSAVFGLAIAYILVALFLELLLFVFLFIRVSAGSVKLRLIVLQLNLGLALTISGLGPSIYSAISAILLLGKDSVRQVIFVTYTSWLRPSKRALLSRSRVYLVLLFALCLVLVYGNSVKTSTDLSTAASFFTDKSFTDLSDYLIERFSVNFYSLRISISDLQGYQPLDNLFIPLHTVLYRASSLLGGFLNVQKQNISSISSLNYNLINYFPLNAREGTSPGLIASFQICLPHVLVPFGLTAYLYVYNQIQRRLRRLIYFRLSFAGEFLLLMFTSYFFASPFDIFLIFDTLTVAVVAYTCLSLFGKVGQYHTSSSRSQAKVIGRSEDTGIR